MNWKGRREWIVREAFFRKQFALRTHLVMAVSDFRSMLWTFETFQRRMGSRPAASHAAGVRHYRPLADAVSPYFACASVSMDRGCAR